MTTKPESRITQALSAIVQSTPLRRLQAICEHQKTVSCERLARMLEDAHDAYADYAMDIKFGHEAARAADADLIERLKQEAQTARNALARSVASHIDYSLKRSELDQHLSDGIAADKARIAELEAALGYYARGEHFLLADPDAWDTCSGEAPNWLHDEDGTASIEDGSVANAALSQQAEPAVEQLPYWEPCNPGCDPEFNGKRSRHCAELCHGARDALSQQGKENES